MRTPLGNGTRLAVLVLLVLAPLLLNDFRTLLLTEILTFGLFAASLDLLLGYTGLPSLGHAAYLGVGAFTTAHMALHVTSNVFAQLVVAMAASAAIALAVGIFAVRARGVYFLMLTLAFGQLLFQLATNWSKISGGSNGLPSIPQPTLGVGGTTALAGNTHFYFYALAVFLAGYVVLRLVVSSPFGRALGGIRENETRMSSIGYNVALYKLAAFTIAGAIAGLAGALVAQRLKFVSPDVMRFEESILAVIALIIGGQRSLVGPVIGAGVYYVISEQMSSVFSSHWPMVIGGVFVLVVYVMPGGIVGLGRTLRAAAAGRLRRRAPAAEPLT
jgi:branched-chain amino acid transport system permease protein